MSMVRAWLRFVRVSQFHEKNCSHDFPLYSVVEFLKALKVGKEFEGVFDVMERDDDTSQLSVRARLGLQWF